MSDGERRTFIEEIVEADLAAGKNAGQLHTRFPPEPNGYLHIGHAKSICINFGLAAKYGGKTNLRLDDTNPSREELEYVESIKADVRWLGFDWEDRLFYASDYFEQLHGYAVALIEKKKAFVCELDAEALREYRGSLTEPGKNSPYRERSVEENLDLFRRMKAGEFADGSHTLRAKIDMASPNVNLRDPVIYRIQRATHHRTGDAWCIYPMYDWAHGQSDSLEGITHSICTLEFENHRPLYDWFLEQLGIHHPRQIEFNRLNLTYTVMSKRKLARLVKEAHVGGWDDPRMPTLSGMRRRGFTATAIREFCHRVGVTKIPGTSDIALLEHIQRDDLNKSAARRMVVLEPLKVVIENWPEGHAEELAAVNNPEDPEAGTRAVLMTREVWIERGDFAEEPPRKWRRLKPEGAVRLRYGYVIDCQEVVKNEAGEISELRCVYDPDTRSGTGTSERKVKGAVHWVSAAHAVDAEVRLFEHLFKVEDPEADGADFVDQLNPESLALRPAKLEPSLRGASLGESFQFERSGYFCLDTDSSPEALVFNRTLPLRSSFGKKKPGGGQGKGQGKKNKQNKKSKQNKQSKRDKQSKQGEQGEPSKQDEQGELS